MIDALRFAPGDGYLGMHTNSRKLSVFRHPPPNDAPRWVTVLKLLRRGAEVKPGHRRAPSSAGVRSMLCTRGALQRDRAVCPLCKRAAPPDGVSEYSILLPVQPSPMSLSSPTAVVAKIDIFCTFLHFAF